MTLTRLLLVAGLLAVSACNGNSSAEPDETAPVPTAPPTTASTSTVPDSNTTTSSVPETTTEAPEVIETTVEPTPSTSVEQPDPYLPADLGTVIDSATGVESPGEVTELLPGVWFFVPSEPDSDDANVVPPLPEDREILTAYAETQAAYHEQASTNPIDPSPSSRLAASLVDGGQRLAENVLEPAAANNTHLDLTDGILLRPVVIADPRSDTEAFIFDCQLDGTVFVNDDDDSFADGQTPGVKQFPQIASLVKVDGVWLVERLTRDERACA